MAEVDFKVKSRSGAFSSSDRVGEGVEFREEGGGAEGVAEEEEEKQAREAV